MQSRCILVLGMHRGGTSAFAGTLQALGVDFGDDLLPGQVENPLGFFEDRTVVRVNDDILDAVGSFWCDPLPDLGADDWERHARELLDEAVAKLGGGFRWASLWGLKDPRLCRLLPLWLPLLTRQGSVPCVVIAVRHPAEVAASLVARNRMEPKNAQLLWLEHLLAAEANSRDLQRVFVTYDGLMSDWRGTVARIASTLGFDWPHLPEESATADRVGRFLQPALRHHHHHEDPAGTLRAAGEVYGLFARLAALPAGSADAEPLLAALDEHRRLAREWSWQHTEENIRLRRERHHAQEIIESNEVEIRGLRADRTAVVADRAKAQEIIETCEEELCRLRGDVTAVMQDRRKAQEILETYEAEILKLRTDRDLVVADRRKAQDIIETQAAELLGLRADRELIVADRRTAQDIIEAQESDLKELRANREFAAADRRKAQEIMEAYEAEVGRLRSEHGALVTDRRLAQEVLEGQAAKLRALHVEQEALVADRREAHQTLEIQVTEIETLRERDQQAQATIQAQADELETLHEKARAIRESPHRAFAAALGATRRYLRGCLIKVGCQSFEHEL